MPQALPARNILDGTALPSTSTMKTALGQLRDYLLETLGPVGGVFTGGLRNRIINGGMAIDQRNAGAAQTITAGAALAYCIDRWYAYCTGANVTGQRVAGSGNTQFRYRFTGAASVTKIGFAQRIEAANSFDLNSRDITVGVELANSLLTTVNWSAWYANTADTFGTLASPTRTLIGSGAITVNATATRYYVPITLPAGATTGLEIEFSVGAQTSGTWTIGEAALVAGSASELWREQRPIGLELALCQRYYVRVGPGLGNGFTWPAISGFADSTAVAQLVMPFPAPMRIAPTALEQSGTAANYAVRYAGGSATDCSAVPAFGNATVYGALFTFTVAAGLTAGQALIARTGSASGNSAYLGWSAEL